MFRNDLGNPEDVVIRGDSRCPQGSSHPFQGPDFADPEVKPLWTAEVATEGTLACHQCHQIHVDLSTLERFAVVTDQFADVGVTFENAVALEPSNPAYPTRDSRRVLMGAPTSGWLSATFHQPVAWVGAYITGSRTVLMSAFDAADRLLAKIELPAANLANGKNELPPNYPMLLHAEGIASIHVHCAGGQFTLGDFSFSY